MSSLADTLKGLKDKINNFEGEVEEKLKKIEETEKREKKREQNQIILNNIIQKTDPIVTLNVGGKLFKITYSVLVSVDNTLFTKLYENKQRINEVLFYDRSYKFFPVILNYLRNKSFDKSQYDRMDIEEIKFESDFYSISCFSGILDEILNKVEVIGFKSSAKYSNCGTHKFEDLSNKDLKTGICVQSPYFITLELNNDHEIDKIEIAGLTGNSSWSATNGANSQILTSLDGVSFKNVGTIPSNFGGQIQTVTITKSVCRYIKFQHNSYLGLGYFNVVK